MNLPKPPVVALYMDSRGRAKIDVLMRAYGAACARAALEEAARVCQNERLVFSDEEWRVRCELADAIRAMAKETT